MATIPWSEVGEVNGLRLLSHVDATSKQLREAFEDSPPQGVENFAGARWRYETALFMMFWMMHVGNSPKLRAAGATVPLLDAYHLACARVLVDAGLIGSTDQDIRRWESDLADRFARYSEVYRLEANDV